jgi:hypothetical protein
MQDFMDGRSRTPGVCSRRLAYERDHPAGRDVEGRGPKEARMDMVTKFGLAALAAGMIGGAALTSAPRAEAAAVGGHTLTAAPAVQGAPLTCSQAITMGNFFLGMGDVMYAVGNYSRATYYYGKAQVYYSFC